MHEYTDKLRTRYVNDPVKWATIAGFLLAIIGIFGSWATLDAIGIDLSTNGFDHNGTLILILALVGLGAILAYAFANLNFRETQLLWGLVAVALVIDVLVLIDFLDILTEEAVGTGWGLWLTLIGALLATVGAVVPMWSNIRARAEGLSQR